MFFSCINTRILFSRSLSAVVFIFVSLALNTAVAAPESYGIKPPSLAIGQMALGLVFVTGLIVVLAWCAKRIGLTQHFQGQQMRVLSQMPLGRREKLVLVQCGDTRLLLGVTAQQVNCLHSEYCDEQVQLAEQKALAESGTAATGWKHLLQKNEDEQGVSTEFQKMLTRILKKNEQS